MVEAVLAPTHADAFEALLNKPLTSTFNKAAANRKSHLLQFIVLDMVAVLIQVIEEFC